MVSSLDFQGRLNIIYTEHLEQDLAHNKLSWVWAIVFLLLELYLITWKARKPRFFLSSVNNLGTKSGHLSGQAALHQNPEGRAHHNAPSQLGCWECHSWALLAERLPKELFRAAECGKWGSFSLSGNVGLPFTVIDSWESAGSCRLSPGSRHAPVSWHLGNSPRHIWYSPWWLAVAQQPCSLWARWSQCGSHIAQRIVRWVLSVWQLGTSTRVRHPFRQSASNAHRRQRGAVGALPFAQLFWKETFSVQRVWLAQNQDCLLWIQLHVFFPPRVIFLLEDYRHIWLIFQVLWQPLKLSKQKRWMDGRMDRWTDRQINNEN